MQGHASLMTDLQALRGRARSGSARQHLTWLAAGFVVGFVIPFLFADVLQLPRDLYYGVYITSVLAFFVLWARTTGQRLDVMVRRRWRLAVVLGVVVALILSIAVVLSEPATPGPEGMALIGAVLWRGVAYGAADGLLLSAFPILAVFAAAKGSRLRQGKSGTVAVGAAALLASLVIATVYHLGYRDFRSPMLARPVTADIVWSVPTLLTLNPIGTPITHAAMHVTAVLHSSETQVFLPPHR
jgi:hypothetical protein